MGVILLFLVFFFFPLLLLLFFSTLHQKKRLLLHLSNSTHHPHPLFLHPKPSPSFCFNHNNSRVSKAREAVMEERREEQKPVMGRKISLQNIDATEDNNAAAAPKLRTTPMMGPHPHPHPHPHSHHQQVTSPPSSPLRKSSSTRSNCLCSPTTHVGSFRCRLHRHGPTTKTNIMRRGHSVGSNLSDLAHKFSSPNPTTLATSSLQSSASSSQMQQ